MSQYNSKPITQLTPGGAVLATDVYPAVDITDLSQSSSGTTKKYSISQLISFFNANQAISNIETALVATTGNLVANYDNGPNNDGIGATLVNSGALGALTIDGITLLAGSRVLVDAQVIAFENGVYVVSDAGDIGTPWVMTRASDFDGSADGTIRQGDFIGVLEGILNALTFWFVTSTTPVTVGVDPITFQKQVSPITEAWTSTAGPTQQMAVNTGYTVTAPGVILTLPAVSAVGNWVELNGDVFTIAQNAGNAIFFGGVGNTTLGVGGSLSSTVSNSSIKLRCVVANVSWDVSSEVGTFLLI